MRVPWWLRNPGDKLEHIKRRIDKSFVSHIDRPLGLEKTPPHYQARFMERKNREPLPVHYEPVEVPYEYNPRQGVINRIEDTVPILPFFPPESHYGLWGGEGMIRGFSLDPKKKYMKKNPRWWYPTLSQVTLYSEILDKYLLTIVTKRTLTLIDEAKGFDFYLLKTHEVDLQSRLGMRLKGELMRKLANGSLYPDNPTKNKSILQKYQEFIIPEEEADWVGLTLAEAERKYNREQYAPPVPLREVFREQLLLQLQKLKLSGENVDELKWSSRLNPFSKSSAEVNPEKS